jgi:hypothetical protein
MSLFIANKTHLKEFVKSSAHRVKANWATRGYYNRAEHTYTGIRIDMIMTAMHRSAYIIHGMDLSPPATATRPRSADKVKSAAKVIKSTPAMVKTDMMINMIPGTKTNMLIARSGRAE